MEQGKLIYSLEFGSLINLFIVIGDYNEEKQDAYGCLRGMSWCMFITKCIWKHILPS